MHIESQAKGIYSCVRCGVCVHKYNSWGTKKVCPVREHTSGLEPATSRGRIQIAKGILQGELEFTPEMAKSIYECLLCGNCRQACGAVDMQTGQPKIDNPAITRALRADLFASGVKLPEAVNMFSTAIEKAQNIFGAPKFERTDWLTDDIRLDPKADTIYFPGCLPTYRVKEVAVATAGVLNRLGIPFNILGEEEQCCGNPMLMIGNLFLAREMARHNFGLLKGKRIITSCAGCFKTLKEEYARLLGQEYKLNAVHIVQVLAGLVDEGKVKFTKEVKEKVVYHDPCELGRDMKVFDEPRKIIGSIPGIELLGLERSRENTFCCGGGGGVKGVNYDLSIRIGKSKVEEVLAAGASTIVSACPSCKSNINDAIKATGAKIRAIDITELVLEAGITPAGKVGKNAKNR